MKKWMADQVFYFRSVCRVFLKKRQYKFLYLYVGNFFHVYFVLLELADVFRYAFRERVLFGDEHVEYGAC